jgi:hypothetical protein
MTLRTALVLMAVSGSFLGPFNALSAEPKTDPAVTQATLSGTVCVPGFTKHTRAPSGWLRRLKIRMLGERGEPPSAGRRYQLDHVMPLALGGAVKDPENYALQPAGEAAAKDAIERHLGCLVCAGLVPLETARAAIASDWRAAATQYRGIRCHRWH